MKRPKPGQYVLYISHWWVSLVGCEIVDRFGGVRFDSLILPVKCVCYGLFSGLTWPGRKVPGGDIMR